MQTGSYSDTPLPPLPHLAIQAFCVTPEVAHALDEAARDRRMARVHYTRLEGGVQGARAAYHHAPTPNVLILETVQVREQVLADLDALAEVCDPSTKVIVVGHVNDVVLYRELIRRGVSDYLVHPFHPLEFVQIISDLYAGEKSRPMGRMVAFFGSRGGVGTSTIAHNVAVAATQVLDRDAVIVDMDLAFGSGGLNFNLDPAQGIQDALTIGDKVDAIFLDRLMVQCADRVKLLGAPATIDYAYDLPETAAIDVFNELRRMVPLTIVDMPHQWTSFTRRMLIDADDVVLVATPDLASLRNVKTLADQLARLRQNDRPALTILTQVGLPKRPEIHVEDFKKALGSELAAVIGFDAASFGAAANEGRPLVEVMPRAPAVKVFEDIAALIGGRMPIVQKREASSLLDSMLSKLTHNSKSGRG